jgi:hypothetical protein
MGGANPKLEIRNPKHAVEIPNHKHQITNKSKIRSTKFQTAGRMPGLPGFEFGALDLFRISCFGF